MTKIFRSASFLLCITAGVALGIVGCSGEDDAERVGRGQQALDDKPRLDVASPSLDGGPDVTLARSLQASTETSACRHITLSASVGRDDAGTPESNERSVVVDDPAPFAFAIPKSIPVVGSPLTSGSTAMLAFTHADSSRTACFYTLDLTNYYFAQCDDGAHSGDVVQARSLYLAITSFSGGAPSVAVRLDDADPSCDEVDAGVDAADDDSALPSSTCRVIEMTAARSYVPKGSVDPTEVALADAVTFAVPWAIDRVDSASAASAELMYRVGEADWTSCSYAAPRGATTLPLLACSGDVHGGDSARANTFVFYAADDDADAGLSIVHVTIPESACNDAGTDGGATDGPVDGVSSTDPQLPLLDGAPEVGTGSGGACDPERCDDNDVCTTDECNVDNRCIHGVATALIDDGNPCTLDTCDAILGPTHTLAPAGSTCGAAANACAGVPTCSAEGLCVQGSAPAIDTTDPCNVGSCDPARGVVYSPAAAGTACGGNADACSSASTCNGRGVCLKGASIPIPAATACVRYTCDPASGIVATPLASGTLCGDPVDPCGPVLACDGAGACLTQADTDCSNPACSAPAGR